MNNATSLGPRTGSTVSRLLKFPEPRRGFGKTGDTYIIRIPTLPLARPAST